MDKKLIKQLTQWHEQEEHQKIVDAILTVPEEERDYDLNSLLARALNNLGDYETAAEVLLVTEKEGQNDPLWHYRLGYAYYYSDRFKEAREEFVQVLWMTPKDEDAKMFLDWCDEELIPERKVKKLDCRLISPEVIKAGKTFCQRTEEFWDWFTRNEPQLARMVEQREYMEGGNVVEFISKGVRLISEDVNFNVGGNYEFTFAVEGNIHLFYLLPWLVARMPEQFRTKWHFFPYMLGTGGENFGLRMYDKDISLDEVKVGLKYDEEHNHFDLRFFNEQLCSLEENYSYNAFYIMMELTIGELMSRIYIHRVEKAETLEKGMFPLTKLESCMAVVLEEAGKEILKRLDERYNSYKMNFSRNKDLRYDSIIGTTCFPELLGDYFNEETTEIDKLDACGAKAVFLVVPIAHVDTSDKLSLRYEIEDRLSAEILGEKGDGQEIGILLGGAIGKDNLYIDLLLYDAPEFLARVTDWLKQYPHPFYLAEFRPQSQLVALANVKSRVPEIPTKPGELALRMMKYLDCPCQWFAPMSEAHSLDKAYFEALKTGKKEGFVPVLVVVNEALMERLAINADEENAPDFTLENVRAYRKRMTGLTELPDVKAYFEQLKSKCLEDKSEKQWVKLLGEVEDGYPHNHLTGYWDYKTRWTYEMLLVKVPVDRPWKIFAWLPMGGWDKCPDTPHLMAVAKHWYEINEAVPTLIDNDVLEFYVGKPVEHIDQAMPLAIEHYLVCPENVEKGGAGETISKWADSLVDSKFWYFWWE